MSKEMFARVQSDKPINENVLLVHKGSEENKISVGKVVMMVWNMSKVIDNLF